MGGDDAAVVVEGVAVSFGSTRALRSTSFEVPRGTVLGLLGPNGAGKTTAVRVLTTLLRPDAGRAEVLGMDVVRDAARVRSRIGLAGQYAAVDDNLTGRENLELFGELYRLGSGAGPRSRELLEEFDLVDAADRVVKTYSGGMRRRLDLAASLVHRPEVLFLDEPTTGLDPRSRQSLWEVIEELVGGGTTLLLTTQYLEEADRLADRIAVIDHGTVIAEGTSEQLKQRVGGSSLVVRVDPQEVDRAVAALAPLADGSGPSVAAGEITVAAPDSAAFVVRAAAALDDAGVTPTEIALRQPTLDSVFFQLTGQPPVADDEEDGSRAGGANEAQDAEREAGHR